jgi:hypothetical protein
MCKYFMKNLKNNFFFVILFFMFEVFLEVLL